MSSSSNSESSERSTVSSAKTWLNWKICKCTEGCKNLSCSCYENGSECKIESCKCSSSCGNLFNNLEYFFGEDEQIDAHPCFAQWLSIIGMSFENINRYELRDRIINCRNFSDAIDLDWRLETGDYADELLSNCQELFRLVLSKQSNDFYFSFCHNELRQDDSYWHCRICGRCNQWRYWHCEKCNQCTYGQSLPCERCGRSTDDESSDDDFYF